MRLFADESDRFYQLAGLAVFNAGSVCNTRLLSHGGDFFDRLGFLFENRFPPSSISKIRVQMPRCDAITC